MTIKRQHLRLFLVTFLLGTTLAISLGKAKWPQFDKPQAQSVGSSWRNLSIAALPQLNPYCCTTSPIGKVDFKNFTYPSATLKDGEFEFSPARGCYANFSLSRVSYQDFTGDGQDEAIVELLEHFVGGSSSNYIATHIYQFTGTKPRLLWRFATGSEGYCGSGASYLDDKELVFELFGDCSIAESEYKQFNQPSWDGDIPVYSIIRVSWNGRRFRQKSRQVLPFPYKNGSEYYQALSK